MGCYHSSVEQSHVPSHNHKDKDHGKDYVVPSHDHGIERILDCLRDAPDHRDKVFDWTRHSKNTAAKLPASVDLREAQNYPVYEQGDLGSCTANALCAAFQYMQRREGLQDFRPSRLFVYYNERDMEGSLKQDSGARLRDGIKSLYKCGVCDERLWPYNVETFKKKPTPECYEAAKQNCCVVYARVEQTVESLKGCLAAGFPFVFGFLVFCELLAGDAASSGVMEWPPLGTPHGGHAVQACGYDDERQCFIVRNSWGEAWGDKGFFYMPYKFIVHPQLCHDFWVMVLVDGTEFPVQEASTGALSSSAQLGGA